MAWTKMHTCRGRSFDDRKYIKHGKTWGRSFCICPRVSFLTFETKGQKRKDRPCVSSETKGPSLRFHLRFLAVIVFMATRQPYAGIVCFAFLVIKGFLIAKTK